MTDPRLAGLYAITPAADTDLAPAVEAALRGGARVIQFRDKHGAPAARRAQAETLLALCRAHDALLLVNDDVELAAAIGAHGVHLGQDDMPPAVARARLGAEAVIGVTCHASLALAEQATAAGADYVAFGRFFASRSKPEAPPAPVALLGEARRRLALPIVAIGGITPENGAQLIAAGAHMLAVIEGIFGRPDSEAAARACAELFRTNEYKPNYTKESP